MYKILLLSAALLSAPALANLVVIVNPANTSAVDQEEVQRIYTGRSTSLSAANLLDSNELRSTFDTKVTGRSSAQLKAAWSKLLFTGKGVPPTEFSTEDEVVKFVAENPKAIGYVNRDSVTPNVKIALDVK